MNIRRIVIITLAMVLAGSTQLIAAMDSGHQVHEEHMSTMNAQQNQDMFLEKKVIDGYTVSFHMMKVDPGMEHGGNYNFMVKVEEQGKVLDDIVINSKVIDPDGEAESKFLNKMGDWYMNGYNITKKGKYQLIILFKTVDGEKHNGGVYYESTME